MNNHIQYHQVVERLNENNLDYQILDYQNGFKVIVMERGGRIIGPFWNEGESLLWLNDAFSQTEVFSVFLGNEEWNTGAERLWLAPEFPFFNQSREDFFNSYTVQPEIDPGEYCIIKKKDKINLNINIDVPVFEMPFKNKALKIERTIEKADNPLKYIEDVSDADIQYCGIKQSITTTDFSIENVMPIEPWILTQINPGGYVLVPFAGQFSYVDYYEPVDGDVLKTYKNYAAIKVCGKRRFKIAFKSANTFGRAGYINKLDDRYYLIIKNYYNDPSNPYVCEPWHNPNGKGCSLYIYNDSGDLGGFAEFENSGCTLDGRAQGTIQDSFTEWFFLGSKKDIKKVIYNILGIKYHINF